MWLVWPQVTLASWPQRSLQLFCPLTRAQPKAVHPMIHRCTENQSRLIYLRRIRIPVTDVEMLREPRSVEGWGAENQSAVYLLAAAPAPQSAIPQRRRAA